MPRKPKPRPRPSTRPETVVLDDPEDDAAALGALAEIAAGLARAASGSEEEKRIADQVFGLLGSLSKDAQKRVMSRPEAQALFEAAADKDPPASPSDPPGTVYYRTFNGERIPWAKKPWTWKDLETMPKKTLRPERRQNLIWNGLAMSVFPRKEYLVPEVFYGVYYDALRSEELAEEHAAWLMKKRDTLSDPSIVTRDGAAARAIANHDGRANVYVPGGGPAGLFERADGDIDK